MLQPRLESPILARNATSKPYEQLKFGSILIRINKSAWSDPGGPPEDPRGGWGYANTVPDGPQWWTIGRAP